jgi:hypothetical protein
LRHLFVAPSRAAFGEVVLALRLAERLAARGEHVSFLAPSTCDVLLTDRRIARGSIDKVVRHLDVALPEIVRDRRCDRVVLVDLTLACIAAAVARVDPEFLARLPVPTIALDVWNLAATDLVWDVGGVEWTLPDVVRRIDRRLVPVPFARPDADAGCYDALPDTQPLGADERARVRAELGVGGATLVVLPTARFQALPLTPAQRSLVDTLPGRVRRLIRRSGVELVHVGPAPLPDMPPGYRHLGPLEPRAFLALVGAADVVLTINQAATTITSAIALEVAVVCAVGRRPFPFRVFPLGLDRFLAPVLAGNPYTDAIATVDWDDEDALVAAVLGPHDEQRARARRYRDRVRALPDAVTAYLRLAA